MNASLLIGLVVSSSPFQQNPAQALAAPNTAQQQSIDKTIPKMIAEIHFASAPPSPTRARARGARRAYDTNISWTGVESANMYEAVWRQTTSSDWEGAKLIAEPRRSRGMLSALLSGICLDDVVVGIRAVAADGSRSRAITPPEPDAFNQRRVRRNR